MEKYFTERRSEFHTRNGKVTEHFYVNRQSVPDSGGLLHLRLWMESEWNHHAGSSRVSASAVFIGLVLSGGQHRVTSESEQYLTAGDLLLERQKDETIRFRSMPGEPLRRLGVLVSRTAALDALICALFPERTTVIRCGDPNRMKSFFTALKDEISLNGGREDQISLLLFSLLQETAARYRKKEYPAALCRALEFIQAGGFRQISRDELASHTGISVRTLTELFRTHLHTSPGKYMSERRIAYAEELLAAHRLTVADVSRLAGFSSVEFFIREFRRHTGKTPGKY